MLNCKDTESESKLTELNLGKVHGTCMEKMPGLAVMKFSQLAACLLFMLEFFEKWTFVGNSNSSCEVSAHVPTSLSS